jgi:hypothetical protein
VFGEGEGRPKFESLDGHPIESRIKLRKGPGLSGKPLDMRR